ncbi:MAG: hypothetical protein ACFFD6_09445 [Candidatus Thorarchaeota archaeon]
MQLKRYVPFDGLEEGLIQRIVLEIKEKSYVNEISANGGLGK